MTDRVDTAIGAAERPEPPSAEDRAADPDLDRWQEERWAPHSFEPVTGEQWEHARGDGSYHDRTLAEQEQPAEPEDKPVEKPKGKRKRGS